MRILVTGGAGFIGSAVMARIAQRTNHESICLDALTYAGNMDNLVDVIDGERHRFERVDIRDAQAVAACLAKHDPDAILHLAAESHVDRSIDGPGDFVSTNVTGTYVMLDAALAHWRGLAAERRAAFRFVHVSTDEVYGTLGAEGLFTEDTPYRPNSPYSASKAGSDHLARAWHETYGLPVIITNCTNNYGPRQFPEKLIPVVLTKALAGEPIPVYGKGENVRDWLYVDDHAEALLTVLEKGAPGRAYNIGGEAEKRNIDLVRTLCAVLDEARPDPAGPRERLITFVEDRPGHDLRYAMDISRIRAELGWSPRHAFEDGLRATVGWYLGNEEWLARVRDGRYRGERLGLARG